MGASYKFRKQAMINLKPYEGQTFTAKQLIEITGCKTTHIQNTYIGRHCVVSAEITEGFRKNDKFKVNETIDIGRLS